VEASAGPVAGSAGRGRRHTVRRRRFDRDGSAFEHRRRVRARLHEQHVDQDRHGSGGSRHERHCVAGAPAEHAKYREAAVDVHVDALGPACG
jgi:hypothetical protein